MAPRSRTPVFRAALATIGLLTTTTLVLGGGASADPAPPPDAAADHDRLERSVMAIREHTTTISRVGRVSGLTATPVGADSTIPNTLINGASLYRGAPWFVYAKRGETILAEFTSSGWQRAQYTGPARITVTDPRGDAIARHELSKDDPTDTRVGGTLVAETEGVYRIDVTDSIDPGSKAVTSTAGLGFRIGVVDHPGRAWVEQLGIDTYRPVDLTLYALSPRGATYRVSARGYDGVSSIIAMNNVGVHEGEFGATVPCKPRHESVAAISSGADHNARPTLRTGIPSSLADCAGLTPYRLFPAPPSADIPAEIAQWADASTRPADARWGRPAYERPEITGLAVSRTTPASNASVVTGTLHGQPGTVNVELRAGDVKRSLATTLLSPGPFRVVWDGTDEHGVPVPPHVPVQVTATSAMTSPIHFVRNDAERSKGGLEIEAIAGGEPGPLRLHWDDTALAKSAGARTSRTTPLTGGPEGTPSQGGVHGWEYGDTAETNSVLPANANNGTGGSWGDTRAIHDWTFLRDGARAVSAKLAPVPSLRIDKAAIGAPVHSSDGKRATITWQVHVRNDGPGDTTNTIVRDQYPADIDPASVSVTAPPTQGRFNALSGTWVVGRLAEHTTARVELRGSVPVQPGMSITVRNRASVTSDQTPPPNSCEPNDGLDADTDRCDAALTPIVSPVLRLDKEVIGTPVVDASRTSATIRWRVVVRNDGPGSASGTRVQDVLPAQVVPGSVTLATGPSHGTFDTKTGIWTIGTLARGVTARLEFTGTIPRDAAPADVINLARVSADEAPWPGTCVANVGLEADTDQCDRVATTLPRMVAADALASTGATGASLVPAAAVLLLGMGAVLTLHRMRRRSRSS